MKIAYFISRVFDPGIIFALLVAITIWASDLNVSEKTVWSLIFEILIIILPLLIFYWLYKTKRVSDVDISRKEERWKLFVPTTALWAISTFLVFFYNLPIEIKTITIIGLSTILIWTIVTPFYKISAHIAGVTSATLFLWLVLNLSWMIFAGPLLIILVFWSRLVQNRHTVWQMIWALILSVGLDMSIIRYLFR